MTLSKHILIGAVILLFVGGCTAQHKLLGPYSKACKIRYQAETFTDNWQSPHETAKLGTGDCEDQAFYLWHEFKKQGVKSRVVFGLLDIRRPNTLHAWVEMPMGFESLILDPSSGIMVPKSMMFMHYIEVHGIPGLTDKVTEFKKKTGLSGFNKIYENPDKLGVPMLILPQSLKKIN